MPFSFENLVCDMHSSLDVIKGFRCIKDCEDNSPIVTADPRDELTVFGKIENFAPGSLLASSFSSIFQKNMLCIKFLLLK
jgi:hypothetical protein